MSAHRILPVWQPYEHYDEVVRLVGILCSDPNSTVLAMRSYLRTLEANSMDTSAQHHGLTETQTLLSKDKAIPN